MRLDPQVRARKNKLSVYYWLSIVTAQAPGIPRIANVDGSFPDGDKEVAFKKGDMIFASTWSAGRVRIFA